MCDGEKKPARERFGKCPVKAHLTDEAVQRVLGNEYLCAEEYGVGVGDPQTGWWSVNWVNTPAMGPGPARDQESGPVPKK